MEQISLVVRCFAERLPDGQWQAFSIEFGLAAQADSMEEVRQKLDAMINDYVVEALTGEDRPYARQLLDRRAPWKIRAKYNWFRFLSRMDGGSHNGSIFDEPLRLSPTPC